MPSPKRWRLRHVAVFIESAREVGRRMLQGIARYNTEHGGRWTLYFEPHSLEMLPPAWLRNWHGDGILARVTTRQQAAAFQATGLPVLDLRGALVAMPFPAILADNRQVAQLAFTHLHERGLTHFAYCGLSPAQHWHQSNRSEEFRRRVEESRLFLRSLLLPEETNRLGTRTRSIGGLVARPAQTTGRFCLLRRPRLSGVGRLPPWRFGRA